MLYFTINDLAKIEPMYQFSLEWYENVFKQGVELAPMSNSLEERLVLLTNHFTYLLYCNVCRSLFSQHKLIFSFLLCLSILQNDKRLLSQEIEKLYEVPKNQDDLPENPSSYISENIWPYFYSQLQHLSSIKEMEHLESIFMSMPDSFQNYCLS